MKDRPIPGDIVTREINIPLCGVCGYSIDMNMCSYGCSEDGDVHKDVIVAVYKRTDEFLRDEKGNQSSSKIDLKNPFCDICECSVDLNMCIPTDDIFHITPEEAEEHKEEAEIPRPKL